MFRLTRTSMIGRSTASRICAACSCTRPLTTTSVVGRCSRHGYGRDVPRSPSRTMEWMFINALAFDRDIGDWAVHSVRKMGWMFHGASLLTRTSAGAWTRTLTGMDTPSRAKGSSSCGVAVSRAAPALRHLRRRAAPMPAPTPAPTTSAPMTLAPTTPAPAAPTTRPAPRRRRLRRRRPRRRRPRRRLRRPRAPWAATAPRPAPSRSASSSSAPRSPGIRRRPPAPASAA